MEEIKKFLDILFPKLSGELIEVRLLGRNLPAIQKFYNNPQAILEALPVLRSQYPSYDYYVGVCPRSKKEGGKEAVKNVWCLWADLDAKGFPDGKDEALRHIKTFQPQPTVLVDSGNGYHAYWLLREAVSISSQDVIATVEGYLRGVARALGGDSTACDLARILRLPGTENRKDPSQPRPVQLLWAYPERRYTLADFNPVVGDQGNKTRLSKEPGWIGKALKQISPGNRNDTFTKITGYFARQGWSSEDVLELLKPSAAKCQFPEEELRRVVEGIYKRYPAASQMKGRKGRKGSEGIVAEGESSPSGLRERIYEIRTMEKAWLFERKRWVAEAATDHLRREGAFYVTPERCGYFFDNETRKLHTLKEDPFIRYLADSTGLNPTESEFKYLVEHLLTEAYRRGKKSKVYHLAHYDQVSQRVFITDFDSGMWVLDGQSVTHVPNGEEGVLFATTALAETYTYLPKHERVAEATLENFLKPINFDPNAQLSPEEGRELLRLWLLSLFFPELHPTKLIPTFLGPYGATKTTTARRLGIQLLGSEFNVGHLEAGQRGEQAFIATICEKPFAAFDNADSDIRWLPDRLATFATGQVFQLRELYTTNRLALFRPAAHIVLTSRDPQFRRPDVAERLLICRVHRPEKFVAENIFFKQTEAQRISLWSELLDEVNRTLVALRGVPSAPPLDFRMADFSSFGWRLCQAAGGQEAANKFCEALRKLEREQAEYATEDDPTAECLRIWLETRGNLGKKIKTVDLYNQLAELAEKQGLILPKTTAAFGKSLRQSRRALEIALGVRIRGKFTTRTWWWVFTQPGSSEEADPFSSLPTLPTLPADADDETEEVEEVDPTVSQTDGTDANASGNLGDSDPFTDSPIDDEQPF